MGVKKIPVIIAVICVFLTMIGCSYRMGDLTVASTKNVNIGEKYVKVANGVIGKDTKSIILFIPTGNPSIEEAIDLALEKVGGDLMTNVAIYCKYYWIPYIYGETTIEVKGDVWKKEIVSSGLLKDDIKNADEIFTLLEEDGEMKLVEVTALKSK